MKARPGRIGASNLGAAGRVVFVTGAGISQESGIPTFRGADGLWRNMDPMRLASIEAFRQDPHTVWEWYEERRRNIRRAQPNAGHRAVSELERKTRVDVLTQNIDGLHARAGSTHVLELHGNIMRTRCTVCGRTETGADLGGVPPYCACGGMLRPDVVWFGEGLPQAVWAEAVSCASNADVMVVVGTSLAVHPANILPILARENGARLIEVNPEPTEMSRIMNDTIRGTAADVLPRLVRD